MRTVLSDREHRPATMLRISLLLLLGSALAFDYELQKGYRLLYVTPSTQEQARFIGQYTSDHGIDVWLGPAVNREAEIFVSPEEFGGLKSALYQNGMTFKISDRDISAELKEEWDGLVSRGRTAGRVYDINNYNTYQDILDETVRLAGSCGAGLTCTTSVYGASHDGNDLRAITLSTGAGKRIILFDSLIHAREWLAGATLMNILDMMITGYGSDPAVTRLLNAYDFHFIPVMNPDGYLYTWSADRLWRKNRQPNSESSCVGTDLNRNYNYLWGGEPGASHNPCAGEYCGDYVASAPETVATKFYAANLVPNLLGYVTYHSHGYYLLGPYGDCRLPPDWTQYSYVALAAGCTAIENTFGEDWLCGNSCVELYETTGVTVDWMSVNANVRYAITPELRDDGQDFSPPASSIPLSVEQMWNGMVAFVDEIITLEGGI